MKPRGLLSCFAFLIMAACFSLQGGATNPSARSYLGIRYAVVTPEIAQDLHLAEVRGMVVEDVIPGGPAARGGLRVDDVLLELDGKPLTRLADLRQKLETSTPGTKIRMKVLRDGWLRDVVVTLGAPPPGGSQAEQGAPAQPPAGTNSMPQPAR